MTRTIVCIVEGDGEVRAMPLLLRRLAESAGVYDLDVATPIRVRKDRFIRRPDEFSRQLKLAAAKAKGGTVLVVLDADDDCPVELASDIARRAQAIVPHVSLHAVIAQREYEAWLLAAADSLAGKRGLTTDLQGPGAPDGVRNAKGWLSERMPSGRYHEVSDQPALTALFDLALARTRSRSFRKLSDTLERIVRGPAPA
ncbi:MAG TPA: DUF4276 family protein [Quisquiliibacterium sp.]|nr:DUF4276 family protein [Quisquiliibacterium sp.]HQD83840.1 DUF4276 family protein [Quisquiliibacterium sp.]HQN14505.1 DUF4276 family protein [Quisquiliibacterium sp.]HQP66089.1 DUF4276 family protein [Quisquiliibacterium sp.]